MTEDLSSWYYWWLLSPALWRYHATVFWYLLLVKVFAIIYDGWALTSPWFCLLMLRLSSEFTWYQIKFGFKIYINIYLKILFFYLYNLLYFLIFYIFIYIFRGSQFQSSICRQEEVTKALRYFELWEHYRSE